MVFRMLVVLMVSQILILSEVGAQDQEQAFEEILVSASLQKNINKNHFHEYWSGNESFQLDLKTPFYVGEFSLGGRYTDFSDLKEEVPAFQNYQFSVEWWLRKEIISKVSFGAGIGSIFSMFVYEELTDEQIIWSKSGLGSVSSENEAGFIFAADLRYAFTGTWGIRINLNRSHIYTNKKIRLNYFGVGIYKTLKTPDFIQEILK